MVACVFCEGPLACQACGRDFLPRSEAVYEAWHRPEVPVPCPECGKILACRLCGYRYAPEDTEQDVTDAHDIW